MGLKPGSRVLAVPVRSPESSDFFSSDSAKEIDEIDDNVPPIGDGFASAKVAVCATHNHITDAAVQALVVHCIEYRRC